MRNASQPARCDSGCLLLTTYKCECANLLRNALRSGRSPAISCKRLRTRTQHERCVYVREPKRERKTEIERAGPQLRAMGQTNVSRRLQRPQCCVVCILRAKCGRNVDTNGRCRSGQYTFNFCVYSYGLAWLRTWFAWQETDEHSDHRPRWGGQTAINATIKCTNLGRARAMVCSQIVYI